MRPWIKLWTELLNDVRISRIGDRAQLLYVKLYLLAGICDAEGWLQENGQKLSDVDLLYKLRLRDKRLLAADLKSLKAAGLLNANGDGYFIADWKRQQPDMQVIREQRRERDQRYEATRRERDTDATPTRRERDADAPRPRPRLKELRLKDQTEKRQKDLPTTLPSSRKSGGKGRKVGSTVNSNKTEASDLKLTKAQAKRAALIKPILTVSGLRDPKLSETINILATRSFKTDKHIVHYVLAALASAFADPKAANPLTVAAYRIDKDRVPAPFLDDPRLWRSMPNNVLHAADTSINKWGLDHYARSFNYFGED